MKYATFLLGLGISEKEKKGKFTMLNPKEQLFCYYFSCFQNLKEASVKAGYPALSAEKTAAKLMQRKEIQEQIRTYIRQKDTEYLQAMVLSGLERLAFGEINDVIQLMMKGNELDEKQLQNLNLYMVSELKQKDGCLEVKLFDRYQALKLIQELVEQKQNHGTTEEFLQAFVQGTKQWDGDGDE